MRQFLWRKISEFSVSQNPCLEGGVKIRKPYFIFQAAPLFWSEDGGSWNGQSLLDFLKNKKMTEDRKKDEQMKKKVISDRAIYSSSYGFCQKIFCPLFILFAIFSNVTALPWLGLIKLLFCFKIVALLDEYHNKYEKWDEHLV